MPIVSWRSSANASLSFVPTPSVPGDEHRLAEALADLDQRAEAADAGEHFGPHRALGERLDALDQRVAGVDVDAGVAIGEGAGSRSIGRIAWAAVVRYEAPRIGREIASPQRERRNSTATARVAVERSSAARGTC